jgi:type IV secretory pathway VirB2 component (pilin)
MNATQNAALVKLLDGLPVATIIAVILAVVGAVNVLAGHYTWASYLDDMKVLIGLLAVGRGAASIGKRVAVPVNTDVVR